jgi:hypothetical protein
MKSTKILLAAMAATAMPALQSCSDDNNNGLTGGENNGNTEVTTAPGFVIAATGDVLGQSQNVLLSPEGIESGSLSIVGNGLTNDGATQWVFVGDKYLYALTYNQGNGGTTRSYYRDANGDLKARAKEYEIKRFTTFGTFGDYVMTTSTGSAPTSYANADGNLPKMLLVSYLHVTDETYTSNTAGDNYIVENYLGNGEYVILAGIQERDGKIFSGVVPCGLSAYGAAVDGGKWILPGNEDLVKTESGGSASSAYVKGELQYTQYPNKCWVAIYDDYTMTNPKIISTDKISYACGRYKSQYYQTVVKADNGDIYVFSPSYAKTMTDARQQTTLPAGVVRIPAGTTEFDNYYVNIEEQSNGCGFTNVYSMGGSNFLLVMYDRPFSQTGYTANRLAVFNGEKGKLTYVTGIPDNTTISAFSKNVFNYNGKSYMMISVDGGYPAVYCIDAETGIATKGLEIQATTSTAIGLLK